MTALKEIGSAVALFLTATVVGMLIAFLVSGGAVGAPSCMTKAEARAIWPRAHLYWHTADHCWDNRAGGGRRYAARAEETSEKPRAKSKDKKVDPPPPTLRATIIYPSLKQGADAWSPDWLHAFASTTWPQLIDPDDAPDPNAGKDGCCWPRLDQLLKEVWERRP